MRPTVLSPCTANEQLALSWDFSADLPAGVTLINATVSVAMHRASRVVDANPSAILSGAAIVANGVIYQTVSRMTTNAWYLITALTESSENPSRKLQLSSLLRCEPIG